ncbi:MAG: hypothetical protein HXY37_08115 [Chloroflexi bacterium]|nr:hypothetical protein [Chloroflexota bacterium]
MQIQGGITTNTVGAAVQAGATFLVAGTEIFRHPQGLSPRQVIATLSGEAEKARATVV